MRRRALLFKETSARVRADSLPLYIFFSLPTKFAHSCGALQRVRERELRPSRIPRRPAVVAFHSANIQRDSIYREYRSAVSKTRGSLGKEISRARQRRRRRSSCFPASIFVAVTKNLLLAKCGCTSRHSHVATTSFVD